MEEIDVQWKHGLQIWWSWFWRTMIIVLPISFLVGLIIGVFMAFANIPLEENQLLLNLIGVVIGIVFSVYVMTNILKKSFKGYRIALIKVNNSSELDA